MDAPRPSKYEEYVVPVLNALMAGSLTRGQLNEIVQDTHYAKALKGKCPEAYSVIYYIRGCIGRHAVVCTPGFPALYKVADSKPEVLIYIERRKKNIRTQIARTIFTVREVEKVSDPDHELAMTRASLISAFTILDVSMGGTGTI